MKTYTVKGDEIEREWILVDARDQVLGRLASEVARRLRGKHKPAYSPHLDVGDHVVVVNAEKIRLTGRKAETKRYFKHSGHMGSEKFIAFERLRQTHPERIIERAVKGMLPKSKLGRKMSKKLRVYAGPDHPHESQAPRKVEF